MRASAEHTIERKCKMSEINKHRKNKDTGIEKEKKQSPTENSGNTNESAAVTVGFKRAVPIILYAVAAFIALCFITQNTGMLGAFIGKVLLGLFSYGAYAIPLLLVVHGIFYIRDIENKCVVSRTIFSVIAVLALSALAYTIYAINNTVPFSASLFYENGTKCIGGGFIGSVLSFALMKIFGSVGVIIISVAIFALYISFFFAKSKRASGKFLYFLLAVIVSIMAFIEKIIKKIIEFFKDARRRKQDKLQRTKDEELFRDPFFDVDNGMKELNIPELGIKEARSDIAVEENPTLSDKVYHKSEVEYEKPKSESYTVKEPINDAQNEPPKRRTVDFSYGDAAAYEAKSSPFAKEGEMHTEKAAATGSATTNSKLYGLDENAEDVFTKDFNPFDFAMNERLANKTSSAGISASRSREAGIGEVEEPLYRRAINDITPEEVEKARKLYDVQMKREAAIADFEAKKRAALEKMRHQATPVTNSEPNTAEAKSIEFNNTCGEVIDNSQTTTSFHTTFEKSEPTAAEPIVPAPEYDISENTEPEYTAEENNAYEISDAESEAMDFEGDIYIPEETPTEEIRHEEIEPEEDAESTIFSPVYSESEDEKADNTASDIFTPFTEVISEDTRASESFFAGDDILRTERSMLNPIFDDAEEDDEEETEITPEEPEAAPEFIMPQDRNPEVAEMRKSFAFLDDIPNDAQDAPDNTVKAEPKIEIRTPEHKSPVEFPRTMPQVPTHPEVKEPQEEKKPEKPDFSSYEAPSIDILTRGEPMTDSIEDEIQENANKLIETLASFNVTVSIKGVDRGPRITRYEVVPGPGVKVTQVTNLENDIKLNLAADGMRIKAPIPGKSAIGIEIPNKKSEIVRLRDLIETEEYATAKSNTFFCIGKDVAGYPVFNDIAKLPHMLVAGATGMGKSVFINSVMISLLYKARPDEVRFIMIDPKKLEFSMYNGIPHLLVPVVTDPKQAAGALMWAVEQMEKRYEMITAMNVRNIEAYNEKVKKNPSLGEPMTRIIIVIDEFADLMLQVRNPVENLVMSIAQKARAAGIHLVIGTQRPSVNVLTGVIKANIPSRFTCKVVSNVDSRTILEQAGAEKLLNRGDMLYMIPGMSEPERVQSAFVSDNEVEQIMEFLKGQSCGANYDNDVLEEINRQAQKCSKDGDSDDRDERSGESGEGYLNDRQFLDAVEVAVNTGKISTSLLQRKISIGFGKAAKFIDIMEDMGVVSGPNGQKPRDVLITPDEWHEKLARTQLD